MTTSADRELLAAIKGAGSDASGLVAQLLAQHQMAQSPHGEVSKRTTIYKEPDAEPLEVYVVDAREWIAAGAARSAPWDPSQPDAETPPVAEPLPTPRVALPDDIGELRELWKAKNPHQKPPPRAGVGWFKQQLR